MAAQRAAGLLREDDATRLLAQAQASDALADPANK
jgi:hypothetical protein